jgi:hypothetical protein
MESMIQSEKEQGRKEDGRRGGMDLSEKSQQQASLSAAGKT